MLTDNQIQQFQTLFKNRFGKGINKKKAHSKAMKLVRLLKIIYRPMTKQEFESLQIRRQKTNKVTSKSKI